MDLCRRKTGHWCQILHPAPKALLRTSKEVFTGHFGPRWRKMASNFAIFSFRRQWTSTFSRSRFVDFCTLPQGRGSAQQAKARDSLASLTTGPSSWSFEACSSYQSSHRWLCDFTAHRLTAMPADSNYDDEKYILKIWWVKLWSAHITSTTLHRKINFLPDHRYCTLQNRMSINPPHSDRIPIRPN